MKAEDIPYAPDPAETARDRRVSKWLVLGAILSCVFQLAWFAPKSFDQIDFDGMAYTGIAHHLRLGEFHAAINAFRSPLISWLIAGLSRKCGLSAHQQSHKHRELFVVPGSALCSGGEPMAFAASRGARGITVYARPRFISGSDFVSNP